jgi:DNA-binding NarL/FixJ family response regulator
MALTTCRVLLVADDPLVQAGLAALLGGAPTVTITGQISRLDIFI